MSDRTRNLLNEIGKSLNRLPGVFSTAQWGGRAYKLPNEKNDRRKAKLLAFVLLSKDDRAVSVSFKLEPTIAADAVDRYGWVEPHSFRTLAPSGWISATISTKRQLKPLALLLKESRSLYPLEKEMPSTPVPSDGKAGSNPVARRIDRVMAEFEREGWSPSEDADF